MITIQKAPDHWTPDQALAVYEFIDEMRDAIWERYTVQLIELMHEERITTCGGGRVWCSNGDAGLFDLP